MDFKRDKMTSFDDIDLIVIFGLFSMNSDSTFVKRREIFN